MAKSSMTKSRTILTMVALVMGLMLALATNASAASSDSSSSASDQEDCDTITMAAASGDEADTLTDAVIAGVESGEFTLHAPESALDASGAKVYAFEYEGDAFTSVTVPIGDDYSTTSNLTVLFDDDGTVLQYGETLVSENDAGNFNVASHIDGELVSSQDTDLSYMTDAELQQELDATSQELNAEAQSSNTGACLAAVLGVSGIVGGIIAYTCAGACASAAVGVGVPFCVACIAAFATVGGASITAVASCF